MKEIQHTDQRKASICGLAFRSKKIAEIEKLKKSL